MAYPFGPLVIINCRRLGFHVHRVLETLMVIFSCHHQYKLVNIISSSATLPEFRHSIASVSCYNSSSLIYLVMTGEI